MFGNFPWSYLKKIEGAICEVFSILENSQGATFLF